MSEPATFRFEVDDVDVGSRLDSYLAQNLPDFSRTAIRKAIAEQTVTVNDQLRKPSYKLRGNDTVVGKIENVPDDGPKAEDIPLDVIFEDDHVVVINKPSGMVVHPAKGHWSGTLTSALAFHFQQLSMVGGAHRPGIVHRLDRDTSGVIIVAKTDAAHMKLAKQFENREVEKEYFAICRGALDRDRDWIRQPIGPHPYQREKMAVRTDHPASRTAETFYEVDERWQGYVSVRVFPKTGRTHQIRVHLAHVQCPVLCDPLYAGHRTLSAADLSAKQSASPDDILLNRLALHARRLKLRHPATDEWMQWETEVPEPLRNVCRHFSS